MVSSPTVEDTSEEVLDAMTTLDLDSLNDRAGKYSWGYVGPTEAAWELLQGAVEDVVTDMKRRMDLGLETAAEVICCGIVAGLQMAQGVDSDGPLGWVPDFPAEQAYQAVAEMIRTCPAEDRSAVHDRLIEALGALVPDWGEMISSAASRALPARWPDRSAGHCRIVPSTSDSSRPAATPSRK